jgi:hypothetical protein
MPTSPTEENNQHFHLAAAAANGPPEPHMLSKIPLRRVGSIGYDSLIKRICFSPAMIQSKSHKTFGGAAMRT